MQDERKIQDFIRQAKSQGVSEAEARSYLQQQNVLTPSLKEQKTGFQRLAGLVGGTNLAKGIGQTISNIRGTQRRAIRSMDDLIDTQEQLISQIKKARSEGRDTSRLIGELQNISSSISGLGTEAEELGTGGLSNRDVLTSAGQLGLTAAAAPVARGVQRALPGASALMGATRGAVSGGALGGASGALNALGEEDATLQSTLRGAGAGIAGGALVGGAIGGTLGAATRRRINAPQRQAKSVLDRITPTPKVLTQKEYEKALNGINGNIIPSGKLTPEKYVLPQELQQTAIKHAKTIRYNNPARNVIEIAKEVDRQDKSVEQFLKSRNGIFNTGELRNHLKRRMDENLEAIDIDDVRLEKAKEKLIDSFIRNLKKNDNVSLWETRKRFDQSIEKVFSGSPTLQNQAKKELRNAVQDFISERTDSVTYSSKMREMSNLIRIQEKLERMAARNRGSSDLMRWIKNNENVLKASAAAATVLGLGQLVRPGSGGSSS